ncbi:MAG TPA: hypothetical protein VM345_11570 [Acidimicrobiales bacterium]|nr:hypothetical protein [Acidimicrobiales bacterium]
MDDLVDAGLARAPTRDIPDVADHGLANLAPWLGVGAAVVLAAVMWRRHHVSGHVALGAVVLSVVFPPWVIPGAGVIVLTVARCVRFARTSDRLTGAPAAPSSA